MVSVEKPEQAVTEALWTSSAESSLADCTAREIARTLPNHAYTTLPTNLERLTREGLVKRLRDCRSYHYRSSGSRGSYDAELMLEALDATSDREAALVHLAEAVSPSQAQVPREAFSRLARTHKKRPLR